MLAGKRSRNPKLCNKLTAIFCAGFLAPIYEKWLENAEEKLAFWMERFLIESIGRANLCNVTDGGEGPSGAICSEEHRRKISEAVRGERHPNFGKHHSETTRQKLREASLINTVGEKNPRYGQRLTEETRRKISEAQIGEKSSWFGRRHTEETRQKISKANQGQIFSESSRRKMSEARAGKYTGKNNQFFGKTHSAETRQKMRDRALERKVRKQLEAA